MRRDGLTFIELLMAATIFAMLAAGLALHLRGGIDVWRRATSTMASDQRLRVVEDRLRTELANAVLIDTKHMGSGGSDKVKRLFEQHEIAFVAALPRGNVRRLRWLRYEWRSTTKEVRRTDCAFQEAAADTCAQGPVILEGVDDFSLRYAYRPAAGGAEPVWDDTWPDREHLPRLMEARLTLASAAGSTRVETIPIPLGAWHTIDQARQAAATPPPPPPGPTPALHGP